MEIDDPQMMASRLNNGSLMGLVYGDSNPAKMGAADPEGEPQSMGHRPVHGPSMDGCRWHLNCIQFFCQALGVLGNSPQVIQIRRTYYLVVFRYFKITKVIKL